jgi:hypothetical protein
MSSLVDKARAFALAAHQRFHRLEGHSGRHEERLAAVAERCALCTSDEVTLALAWVHDVVENTAVTFGELERELGRELGELVGELTSVSRPSDGTPAAQRAIDQEHLRRASPRAKTVKLAELIEECRVASRPDARVTTAFVRDRTLLLDLLVGGDSRSFEKAKAMLEHCVERAERFDHAPGAASHADAPVVAKNGAARPEVVAMEAAFLRAFSATDIAEPLQLFDAGRPLADARVELEATDADVVGIGRGGELVAFVDTWTQGDGAAGDHARPLRADQSVDASAGLSDVVIVLTRHDYCFVRRPDRTPSVITRGDIQKPAARVWLFGIITLAEMEFARRIRSLWPEDAWGDRLSAGRLEKARAFHGERRRRGQHLDLLDCLQLADKAQLLMTDPVELEAFGFETMSAAKRAARELESLRNNLAHAQDIVTYDWPQIIRLAWRVLPPEAHAR